MKTDRQRLVLLYTVVVLLLLVVLLGRALFLPGESSSTRGFPWLLAILGGLPTGVASTLLGVVSVGVALFLFRSWDAVLALPVSAEARLAGFLLAYRFLERDVAIGECNTLVLGAVAGAIVLARRGRWWGGGVCLGMSVLIQPSPLVFLAWIVLRRHWRMGAGFLMGLGVGFLMGLVPTLLRATVSWQLAWKLWWERPATGHGLYALATETLKLPEICLWGAAGLSVALLLYFSWERRPGVELGWAGHEVAGACALGVLFLPGASEAEFLLLWPAAVAGFEAWHRSDPKLLRRVGLGAWAVAFLLVAGTTPWLVGDRVARTAAMGFPLVGSGALLCYLIADPRLFPRGRKALKGAAPCGT